MEKILLTRGITGIVFSSQLGVLQVTVDWNWSNFASALIGNSEFYPPLHRAGHHHYRNMGTVVEKLRAAGCGRPAAVLFGPHHQRMQGIHQAAFQANHPLPREALSLVRFGLPECRTETFEWLNQVEADGLVFGMNPSSETLTWLGTLPALKAMVTLDRPEPGLPGINTQDGAIAANAVDLVIAQLHRNERGVPASPLSVLPEGEWQDFG